MEEYILNFAVGAVCALGGFLAGIDIGARTHTERKKHERASLHKVTGSIDIP